MEELLAVNQQQTDINLFLEQKILVLQEELIASDPPAGYIPPITQAEEERQIVMNQVS